MDRKTLKLVAKLTWLGYSRENAIKQVEEYESKGMFKDLERIVNGIIKKKTEKAVVIS